jgi:hypothetical protein
MVGKIKLARIALRFDRPNRPLDFNYIPGAQWATTRRW